MDSVDHFDLAVQQDVLLELDIDIDGLSPSPSRIVPPKSSNAAKVPSIATAYFTKSPNDQTRQRSKSSRGCL